MKEESTCKAEEEARGLALSPTLYLDDIAIAGSRLGYDEVVQVFAGDFSSQQPPSEWQLHAAKGVASAVKGVRQIIKETPAAKAEFDHSDGHLIVSESMLIHGRCQYSSMRIMNSAC